MLVPERVFIMKEINGIMRSINKALFYGIWIMLFENPPPEVDDFQHLP